MKRIIKFFLKLRCHLEWNLLSSIVIAMLSIFDKVLSLKHFKKKFLVCEKNIHFFPLLPLRSHLDVTFSIYVSVQSPESVGKLLQHVGKACAQFY